MPHLIVKWGREKLEVNADLNEAPLLLKSQLYAITGVLPERQKVLIKGKTLGDDDWNGITLNDGAVIMMMGSAGDLPQVPEHRQQFIEDMTESEIAAAADLPIGIKNLGNTCYLNATIQYLRVIPEIREALNAYSGTRNTIFPDLAANLRARSLTTAIKDIFMLMETPICKKQGFIVPIIVLQVLRRVFPKFATRDQYQFMQQDANECWTDLVRTIKAALQSEDSNSHIIEQFMEGSFDGTLKNLETEDEPLFKYSEKFLQLSCFLNQEVRYLQSGIKNKFKEVFEKHSEVLGRNAHYERNERLGRLPAYLSIQMVRFFYKEKDNVSAKILKDVKFPLDLDVFDMCTPELQAKLLPMREVFKAQEDGKAEEMMRDPDAKKLSEKKNEASEAMPFSFEDDPGSNNSGFYELIAVITHKGRSSSSGHYVAWIKIGADRWAMCDDDQVHAVTPEEILKLSGGGDWHCAYLLLYGPRILKK